jgi:hypothetical protein
MTKNETQIPFRTTSDKKKKLEKLAFDSNKSINAVVNEAVDQYVANGDTANFDETNLIGKLVPGSKFMQNPELVEVIGNFYRYQIVNAKLIKTGVYKIIGTQGNEIIFQEEK